MVREIQAIGKLILGLSGRESNTLGTIWSFPSGPQPVSRRGASPDSEASRGPVFGRTTAREKTKAVLVPAPGLDLLGGSQERRGGGDSGQTGRDGEAPKRGSDGGASQVGVAATGQLAGALKAQTEAITALHGKTAKSLMTRRRFTPKVRRSTLFSGKAARRGSSESTASTPPWTKGRLTGHQLEARQSQNWRRSVSARRPENFICPTSRRCRRIPRRRLGQTSGCGRLTKRQC